MEASVHTHTKRKKAGLEHIDRDVNAILQIMYPRDEQRQAEDAAAAAQPAGGAVAAVAGPALSEQPPVMLPSPCGTKIGVMFNGKVGWVDKDDSEYELAQDDSNIWFLSNGDIHHCVDDLVRGPSKVGSAAESSATETEELYYLFFGISRSAQIIPVIPLFGICLEEFGRYSKSVLFRKTRTRLPVQLMRMNFQSQLKILLWLPQWSIRAKVWSSSNPRILKVGFFSGFF